MKFLKAPPAVKFFGLKGAALAALGERPGSLGVPLLPLVGSVVGVKLGESTSKRFFMLRGCYRFARSTKANILVQTFLPELAELEVSLLRG